MLSKLMDALKGIIILTVSRMQQVQTDAAFAADVCMCAPARTLIEHVLSKTARRKNDSSSLVCECVKRLRFFNTSISNRGTPQRYITCCTITKPSTERHPHFLENQIYHLSVRQLRILPPWSILRFTWKTYSMWLLFGKKLYRCLRVHNQTAYGWSMTVACITASRVCLKKQIGSTYGTAVREAACYCI